MSSYEQAIGLAADHLGELLDMDAILADPILGVLPSCDLYQAIREQTADDPVVTENWEMFNKRILVLCELFVVDPKDVLEDTERQMMSNKYDKPKQTLH